MRQIEDIFYTNLTIDLTQFIADGEKFNLGLALPDLNYIIAIKQKEIINEYTIFIICYNNKILTYHKYRKSHDCIILIVEDGRIIRSSNRKYLNLIHRTTFEEFKKFCDDYDLMEKYIKFTYYDYGLCSLSNGIGFRFYTPPKEILFNNKYYTTKEFITEIQKNYPEFYKYDYNQIKPVII